MRVPGELNLDLGNAFDSLNPSTSSYIVDFLWLNHSQAQSKLSDRQGSPYREEDTSVQWRHVLISHYLLQQISSENQQITTEGRFLLMKRLMSVFCLVHSLLCGLSGLQAPYILWFHFPLFWRQNGRKGDDCPQEGFGPWWRQRIWPVLPFIDRT